jgi:hypothetical protein
MKGNVAILFLEELSLFIHWMKINRFISSTSVIQRLRIFSVLNKAVSSA